VFAARTALRLTGCNGKTVKDANGAAQRAVVLTFMAQPFTAEMANDLNVKARLFNISTGEPIPEMAAAKLKISLAPQRMRLYMAPDEEMPVSVEVEAVTVSPTIDVRADREGPVYAGTFSVVFPYPVAKDLLWLFHQVTAQVFATFEAEQGALPVVGEDRLVEKEPATVN
jgi:hypothetical protein